MTPTDEAKRLETAAVEIKAVSRWYGNVVAVNDISFRLGPGITALLGPNGAGKSTVLHMMAGFLRASKGTVRVLGSRRSGTRTSMQRSAWFRNARRSTHSSAATSSCSQWRVYTA
jgi:ABC-type multidrug transport system ATPase subunit